MKKVIVIRIIIFLVDAFEFYNKLYLPPPYRKSKQKSSYRKINDTEKQLVLLSNENGYIWYVINERNTSVADDMIKKMGSQNGWTFKQKEGNGLFFKRHGENLIVATQKWTGDYVLVKLPVNFNESVRCINEAFI